MRRTGLTFAPEAGSWRLRQVINKLILEDDLYSAVDAAYSQGWRRVKLYFLTGLPTEMDDDTLGIAELATNVIDIGRKYTKQASCTVSVGGFVPKPHTPFQWFGQNGVDELQRKITLLRDATKGTRAQVKWHDPRATFAEGIVSRGDRRIGRVIERVWRAGGTFQEWSEHFALDRWLDAMHAEGLDPDWYVTRHRTRDEVLPWAHIAAGLHADFLWQRLAGGPGRARAPRLPVDAVLRLRGVHRLRPRARGGLAARARGRQPGHGPGPERAGSSDVPRRAFLGRSDARSVVPDAAIEGRRSQPMRGGAVNPVRLQYTKLGKIRWICHRDVARALERAFRIAQLPLAFTEGFSPRPEGELRAGAVDRARERRRVPRPRARRRDRSRARCRRRSPTRCPTAWPSSARSPLAERAPALQEAVTARRVAGRARPRRRLTDRRGRARRARSTARSQLPALPTSRRRKGREVEEDVRPVIRRVRALRYESGDASRWNSPRNRAAPSRATCSPASRERRLQDGLADARALRTHQWIERDGTRLEPLDADTRPCVPEACAS